MREGKKGEMFCHMSGKLLLLLQIQCYACAFFLSVFGANVLAKNMAFSRVSE